MACCAPRISRRLVAELERLDDGKLPIAELRRRLGESADRLGLTRPSYERVRQLVHETRARGARRGPSTADVLLDIAFTARPAEAPLDHLSGEGVRQRRSTTNGTK